MTRPTPAHIQRMATTITRHLPDRATVERNEGTGQGDAGSPVDAWTVVATQIPCQVAPVSSRLYQGGNAPAAEADHIITFPIDTTVRPYDRITVNGRVFGLGAIRQRGVTALVVRVDATEQTYGEG